jgi:hypothetical protein
MNNKKKYEDMLAGLPDVLEKGLKNVRFTEKMRRNVQDRLQSGMFPEEKRRKPSFVYAAAVIVLLILGMAGLRLGGRDIFTGPQSAVPSFTEVEAMDIDLDGKEPLELVNTWRILETGKEDALLALVWKRDLRGNLQVISVHPFEGRKFLPLTVLSPESYRGNLVVISSTDGAGSIYFCILGFDGDDVFEYREVYSKKNGNGQLRLREIENFIPAVLKK